ncbi:MAG: T9SS type A sorting domain-containing protein [Bacteroidetes bacterium]|nr:T9SS type A sorting domain-containing protein [Bacteroidota bacterium]
MLLFCLTAQRSAAQRIGNYINNGSFEEYYTCVNSPVPNMVLKNWTSINSINDWGVGVSVCNGRVPVNGGTYQFPHFGQSYLWTLFYAPNSGIPYTERFYPKNLLKSTLQAGKIYCVKFYVNITNKSTCGINGFGAYFGDNSIDTINYCNIPLDYITPQIQNPQGNIITDTLSWVAITGTFTANGTEKFLLLGNFLSNDNVDTLMINSTNLPTVYTEVCIDDVSCIPIDLEAYAGRDTTIFLNDSVYIGRENDFAIDTGCVWYKLPSTTAIDTISGMWVKPPIGTHTYVVRQELECSSLKWDTVIVNVKEKIIDTTDISVNELRIENEKLRIYPNPTSGMLNVECLMLNGEAELQIINVLGEVIKHSTLTTKHSQIDVSELPNGIYFVNIRNKQNESVTKKLIIAK